MNDTTTQKLVTCSDCFRQALQAEGIYIKRRVGVNGRSVVLRFVCHTCQSRRRMAQGKK